MITAKSAHHHGQVCPPPWPRESTTMAKGAHSPPWSRVPTTVAKSANHHGQGSPPPWPRELTTMAKSAHRHSQECPPPWPREPTATAKSANDHGQGYLECSRCKNRVFEALSGNSTIGDGRAAKQSPFQRQGKKELLFSLSFFMGCKPRIVYNAGAEDRGTEREQVV